MKRIVLFTWLTPTIDNICGPSALAYHTLKNRPDYYELLIYTTNYNNISNETIQLISKTLKAEIIIVKDDIYNYFHRRHTLAELRLKLRVDKSYGQSNYRLPRKYINQIKCYNPDIVIVFDESFVNVARQLSNYNLIVWGYDCFPLHYSRLMRDSYCFSENNLYKQILHKYKVAIFRELQYEDIPCRIAEVGIDDVNYYKIITKRDNVGFYPHPHYRVIGKKISFEKQKLSILISGKFDVYTYSDMKKLVGVLKRYCNTLKDKYIFTFLGKTWHNIVSELKLYGYNVSNIDWVDEYAVELVKHDIQIFPISVGSGTKGKVLDALSMGLLCIGSRTAMENIYVRHGNSCFQYNDINDIPMFLNYIYNNKGKAEIIAENGRKQVLKWHNPKRVSKLFLEDIDESTGLKYDGFKEYYKVVNTLNSIL